MSLFGLHVYSVMCDCWYSICVAVSVILQSEDWTGFTEDEQYKAAQEILDKNKDLEDS